MPASCTPLTPCPTFCARVICSRYAKLGEGTLPERVQKRYCRPHRWTREPIPAQRRRRILYRAPGASNSGAPACGHWQPGRLRQFMMMMQAVQRVALRGASRAAQARSKSTQARSTVDDAAAMRERERCWSAWANCDTLHLNYMRNSLLATSVGMSMIHFRREVKDRPPLGGLVMTALGLGYAYAGGACHLFAIARLRSTLLSPLVTAAAAMHAVAPPFMLTTAALCFLDRSPQWVNDLGFAVVPAMGLWRPRIQPVEAKPRRWYSSFSSRDAPLSARKTWPLDQHNNSKTDQ